MELNATARLLATEDYWQLRQERLESLCEELGKVGLNVKLVSTAGQVKAIEAYPVGAMDVTKALNRLGWKETSDKRGAPILRHFIYKDGNWPLVVTWGGASFISFEDSPSHSESTGYVANPFPNAAFKKPVFHGTDKKFDEFKRSPQGIYFTPLKSWAQEYYGSLVIAVYVNVSRPYKPTEREIELFYDRDYDDIAELLKRLSPKYDYCKFGGESDSFVVFGNVKIINARTGRPM